jgi:pimeloyl-ACP methyl ester carboxylesterase
LRSLEVETGGSPVGYRKDGAGPNLILLHGGGLDSAWLTWGPVWSDLEAVATIYAPDLPGFGDTPLGSTTPSLEGYGAWLKGFMEVCDIDTAIVAGLSLGGVELVPGAGHWVPRDAPEFVSEQVRTFLRDVA